MMEQLSSALVLMNNNKLGREDGVVAAADDYDSCIDYLPPGFRFHPTDEEIITHYLYRKVLNTKFTASAIGQVDLNKCEPWDLPNKAKMGEKEWYFFCQRDRKYPTGMRTNRATDAGYWKATGKDKEIYKGKQQQQQQGCLVGMKKTLVFYRGRAPKGEKTNWVMHEYRLEGKFSYYNLPKSAKDEWVVCRVFRKNSIGMMNKMSPYSSCSRMNSFGNEQVFLMNSSSLPPLVLDSPHHFHSNTTTTTRPAAPAAGSSFMMNNNVSNQVVLEEEEEEQDEFKSTWFLDNGSHDHELISSCYNPTGSTMENNYYYQYLQVNRPSPNTVVSHPAAAANSKINTTSHILYPQIPIVSDNNSLFSFHGSSSNMGFGNMNSFPEDDDEAVLRALDDPQLASSYDDLMMIKRECKVEPSIQYSNNQSIVSLSQDTSPSTEISSDHYNLGIKNNSDGCFEEIERGTANSSDDHPIVDLDSLWD